jgi:hypothetical protein
MERDELPIAGKEREAFGELFETICGRAHEAFLRTGAHEPMLLVVTKLGMGLINIDIDPGTPREPIAREIGERIRHNAIRVDDEMVFDEPLAIILSAEAWMVEYDPNEPSETASLPPRLHPRREEILQVLLRSKNVSFCRTWKIKRGGDQVELESPKDLSGEGMECVWDLILTGE